LEKNKKGNLLMNMEQERKEETEGLSLFMKEKEIKNLLSRDPAEIALMPLFWSLRPIFSEETGVPILEPFFIFA
jgi:hypothetical protein